MKPHHLVALAGHKALQRVRLARDSGPGAAKIRRQAVSWAADWRRGWGAARNPLAAWLERAGGGKFWVSPEDADDWCRTGYSEYDRTVADAALRGEFLLLGSRSAPQGDLPSWRRDLYTGRDWPLDPIQQQGLFRTDGSDIRTVWEMSRCYHFVPLARAYWSTGEEEYRKCFVRHVTSFLDQNPIGYGPHWVSPMDCAIRAANWSLSLILFAGSALPHDFAARILGSLRAAGLFIERHLEWHPVYRGNHYVSNGVGLLYLGTLFKGDSAGERWFRKGARILTGEIQRQVHPDGVSFEASLGYHRLDTAFFAFGAELLRMNGKDGLPPEFETRLRAMYDFIDAYLPPSGESPMIGDSDDGLLHAIDARTILFPRLHRAGLPAGYSSVKSPASGAFRQGGFYVLRRAEDHVVVRCGAVGLNGAGCHDHNDQLSFEMVLGGRRVVADSGTYCYGRDLEKRHAFRSTAAHSVFQIAGDEQNPIRPDRPWRVLEDRARARCTQWVAAPDPVFAGEHGGFAAHGGALCTRRIAAIPGTRAWEIADRVVGWGTVPIVWRLHLTASKVRLLGITATGAAILVPGTPEVLIELQFPQVMKLSIVGVTGSDRYGQAESRACLVLEGEQELPCEITTVLQAGVPGITFRFDALQARSPRVNTSLQQV